MPLPNDQECGNVNSPAAGGCQKKKEKKKENKTKAKEKTSHTHTKGAGVMSGIKKKKPISVAFLP